MLMKEQTYCGRLRASKYVRVLAKLQLFMLRVRVELDVTSYH